MDGATIFVYVLGATFFGFIVYLGALSRRNHEAAVKSEDKKPRKAA